MSKALVQESRIETVPVEGLFSAWRLKWYPRLVLIGMLTGLLIGVLAGKGAETLTGRLGGDYPAFYAAGRVAARGDWQNLYSFAHQGMLQKDLIPTKDEGSVMPFPYPPFVALAYYPLTLVNFRLSYLLHALLMTFAIAIAVRLFIDKNSYLAGYYDLALAATLLYYPMLRSVLGGQNTAITFLLFIAVWRAGLAGKERLAGLFLGLMLFKPQYAIPLIGLHVLSGRWRTAMSSMFVALALYLIGAYFCGLFWISDWLHYSSWVSTVAASMDGANSVCWLGFLQALLGVESRTAYTVGWGLASATALGISFIWYGTRRENNLSALLGLAAVALVLMPPHVMYYDMALALFAYGIYLTYDKTKIKLIELMWLLGLSQLAARIVGFSPLFFLLVCSGLIAMYPLLRQAPFYRTKTVIGKAMLAE